MKPRPKREEVISALNTLIDADAVSTRHALDIAYDAATVVGIEAGEERERAKNAKCQQGASLQQLAAMGARP